MPSVDVLGIQQAFLTLQRQIRKCNNDDDDGGTSRIAKKKPDEILYLSVTVESRGGEHDAVGDVSNEHLWWNRFITLLPQYSRNELQLSFDDALFDRPENEVFERFFRNVLTTHKTLTWVRFGHCTFHTTYIEVFAKSLDISMNIHPTRAIAPISTLCFYACAIDSTKCELILKALHNNPFLEDLNLAVNEISEISWEAAKALGTCKNLKHINIYGNPLSDQSLCHLAKGLRTNLSLKTLWVSGVAAGANFNLVLDAFEDLLKTFNYRLHRVCGNFGPALARNHRLPEVLHRNQAISPTRRNQFRELHHPNQRIRTLLNKLFENKESAATIDSYHLAQLKLWPIILECIGSKPYLIYRFVRHGNLESFMDQVHNNNLQP